MVLLAGVAALALSSCASNRTSATADYEGAPVTETHAALAQYGAQYNKNPRDRNAALNYAAALRAFGQTDQSVAVMQQTVTIYPNDLAVKLAYAKSLTADGKFQQALTIADTAIVPEHPDWNALSVKGVILDQTGQNEEARHLYVQAQFIAPNEPSLEANIGLSYALTNDLDLAERHLRTAVAMPRASSRIRQNLALVLGLQGRFDEARTIYAAELPPDQVESNMAYIRALLTQQNRWDLIKDQG